MFANKDEERSVRFILVACYYMILHKGGVDG